MNNDFYKQLIEDMPAPYSYNKILCNEVGTPYDFELIEVNSAFVKLTGRKKKDIVGRRFTEVFPDSNKGHIEGMHFYDEIVINGGKKDFEQFFEPLQRWFRVTVYSVEKYYFIMYLTDITTEKCQLAEMERLIEISEDLLQVNENKNNYQKISDDFLKISGAKYAAFNMFNEDGKTSTTMAITGDKGLVKKASDIIGLKIEEKIWQYNDELTDKIKDKIITRFHSISEVAGKSIKKPLIALLEKTLNIGEVIFVKIHKNNIMLGNISLFMEKGKKFDKDNLTEVYARQLGMFIAQKRAEDSLLKEKALTDAIFYSIPGMLYLYDDQSRLVAWNKKHEDITGYTPEELSKMSILDWYKGDEKSQKAVAEGINRAIDMGFGDAEADLQKKDGTVIPMYFTASAFYFENRQYFVGIGMDITERKKREADIFNLSYRDQLTGLYNRRFFEEELKRLDIERNLPLTIAMGDVNGLKLVNDSFGHVTGDNLLKKVAEVISKGCRADDIIARLAGDEFIIILPKTDAIEAKQILKRITSLSLGEKVGSINISISFGYDTKYKQSESTEEIFKNAEDRMYKKKLFEGPNMRGKTIKAIINTLYEKNKREEEHSYRVSALCKRIGEVLELSDNDIEELKTAGLLHDIGKIAIDEEILNKKGKLTEDEYKEVKRHSEIGYRMLNTVSEMTDIANYILHHHERWDGKGYPKGLKGNETPYFSRIIAIADAYDDITGEKSYKSGRPKEVALEDLQSNAGIKYDPKLVSVFIEKVMLNY